MCTTEILAKKIVDLLNIHAVESCGLNSELAVSIIGAVLGNVPAEELIACEMPNLSR